VHGGASKAAYLYPSGHYEFWRRELPGTELPWGSFGENLDIDAPDEHETHVGDRLRVGSALVRVTAPRLPCFKLGIKFGDASFLRRFLESERTGYYVAVEEEGTVAAGDEIQIVSIEPTAPTILELVQRRSRKPRA
jgi:MOSC domain-containing protein YiiM